MTKDLIKNSDVVKTTSDFKFKTKELDIFDIIGMIETVTTIPTKSPTKFKEQFKIYVDDIATPTTKTLYIYSNKTNTWLSVGLT